VKAFGLNRGDLIQREGKYPMPPGTPKELGLEFSGVVAGVGRNEEAEERHEWKMGDEVFGLVYGGAYAEYLVASKTMLLTKPKELSWECCGGLCEVCRPLVNRTLPVYFIYADDTAESTLLSIKLIALDPPK
jgi:NADPH:quinone reductase-like Zn-dependent oxidoreductase